MSGDEKLYVRSSGPEETLECALVWRGLPDGAEPPVPITKFTWTETARAFFERIRRLAKDTDRPEGRALPYADLRAAIQARVDGIVLLQRRILPPTPGEPVFAADAEPSAVRAAANRSVAAWCQLTLRPWVDKLGIDCGDVDALETRALGCELFEEIPGIIPLRTREVPNATASDFHSFADQLLAVASRSLEGMELFPGLGPVHRIIDVEYGNTISFETWPAALPGGDDLYSMVANVSIETRPSSGFPFVVIRAMKRIWCREFPKPNQLFGRRRISVRLAQRGKPTRAVTLAMVVSKGAPAARLNALMFEAQRSSGEAIGDEVAELVRSRGHGPDLFVGVPFRYGYRPIPTIQTGVTLQDQVDLTRRVTELIAHYGFEQPRIRVLPAVKRPSEHHQAVTLYNLITHHFGRVEQAEVAARVEDLFGAPERKSRGGDKPVKTVDIEPLVTANQERLDKAFGKGVAVTLVFLCRRENEVQIFRSVAGLLFGDRVKITRYALPEGVHGTKKMLDGATLTRAERAALRREAWKPLAEQIKSENLVERALTSSEVRKKLFASFEKTIGSIENRYELITYILAAHELIERESGMKAEGMTAAEVADCAMEYWPAAFKRGSDPTELEYLLEEMEGFGIARRTLSGTFALRSRSLLELMAESEADLNRKLEAFKSKPEPPKPFDPKNFRRILGKPIARLDSEGRTSPLTDGQEADLLAPAPAAEMSCGIGVVFGTTYAGIKYVEAALLESRRAKDQMVDIDLKVFGGLSPRSP
jgi:hypothetical protein